MSEIKGTFPYPKIHTLGSKEVMNILSAPVKVTEKIDGSQIGFGVIDGELRIRSKGALINHVMPPKMFKSAVAYIISIKDKLEPGVFYYGECLESPRHNKLKYELVPRHNVALYGMRDADGTFLGRPILEEEAQELGFDVVPLLFDGICTVEELEAIVSRTESFLGGQIEGIVIASDTLDTLHEPIMQAKLVRPEFKEVMHKRSNRTPAPKGSIEETVQEAFGQFCTPARWDKAIQHLREADAIKGNNTDIGPLIKEIQRDVLDEEGEYVKEMLWTLYRKKFLTAVVDGFPRYYQERLLEAAKDAA